MPKLCNQCGSYDPTPRLAADSRCPRCGVLYAKLASPTARGARGAPAAPGGGRTPDLRGTARASPTPDATAAWLAVGAVCVLLAVAFFDADGFVFALDHANLAFHEAGHLFFGAAGETAGLYGGTLGQLVFPLVAAASFRRRRHTVGQALCGVWLFENFLNIARYMGDAQARVLPLVGGGEHDWQRIFSRWGVLEHDTEIAFVVAAVGWLGMIGCAVGLVHIAIGIRRSRRLRLPVMNRRWR